jgi:GT2 family glycosyltransferase
MRACAKLNVSYPGMAALAELLDDALHQDLKTEDFDLLVRSGEHGLLLKHGVKLLRDARQGLFWLARAFDHLLAAGRWDVLLAAVNAALPPSASDPKRLLRERLLAEAAFCLRPPEEALGLLESLNARLWGWWRAQRMAELFFILGRKDKATELYGQLVQAMPWHVNMLLRLDSLLHYEPSPPQDLSATALLLYSWNKADLLAGTLDCLAATEAPQAGCIAVLDNGSTDETPQVLNKAAQGPLGHKLRCIRTRVNVGAPAARNWLLSLEEVRACEFLVFLDDDVVLQPGFLHGLVGAARSSPQFGTIGCRIKAAVEPGFLQSADYNLSPAQPRRSPAPDVRQHVHLFDNCANTPDTGLFTYTRPAAHVSGCCHLLRRETLDTVGGFDVRYSPTQFDDLDRDLRLLASGSSCLYVGEIEVRHVQFSSLAKAKTLSQTGHVLGNTVKLASKFDQEEAEGMFKANFESLRQHCLQASKRVAAAVR